jgi:hypothetical protein
MLGGGGSSGSSCGGGGGAPKGATRRRTPAATTAGTASKQASLPSALNRLLRRAQRPKGGDAGGGGGGGGGGGSDGSGRSSPAASSGDDSDYEGPPLVESVYDVKERAVLRSGARKLSDALVDAALQHLGFGVGCLEGTRFPKTSAGYGAFLASQLRGTVAEEWRGAVPTAVRMFSATKGNFARSIVRNVRCTNIDFPLASCSWKAWRVGEVMRHGVEHLSGDHSRCASRAPFVRCAFAPAHGSWQFIPEHEPWLGNSASSLLARAAHSMYCFSAALVKTVGAVALASAATDSAEALFHCGHIMNPKMTAYGHASYGCGMAATVLSHTEMIGERQLTLGSVIKTKTHPQGIWARKQGLGYLGIKRWQANAKVKLATDRDAADSTEASGAHLVEIKKWATQQVERIDAARVRRAAVVKAINKRVLEQAAIGGVELPLPKQRMDMADDGELVSEVVDWQVQRVMAPWPLPQLRASTRR